MLKRILFLLGFNLLISQTSFAYDSFCRTVIVHSFNQNLTAADLNYREYKDNFLPASFESFCKSIHSNLQSELTQSCRQRGGAKARITIQFYSPLGGKTLSSYTAFCQDLAPDLFVCTRWDKVLNQWVSTDDPSCYGGGDGDGSGGDGDGSGGGDGSAGI